MAKANPPRPSWRTSAASTPRRSTGSTAALFIETEEREELFAALHLIVGDAEAKTGQNLKAAGRSLIGAEAARNW